MAALTSFFLKLLFSVCTAPIFFTVGTPATLHPAVPANATIINITPETKILNISLKDDAGNYILQKEDYYTDVITNAQCPKGGLCAFVREEVGKKLTNDKKYVFIAEALTEKKELIKEYTVEFTYKDCAIVGCDTKKQCEFSKEPVEACWKMACDVPNKITASTPWCKYNTLTPEECKKIGGGKEQYFAPICWVPQSEKEWCDKLLKAAWLEWKTYSYWWDFVKYTCNCTSCVDIDGDWYGAWCSLGADCSDRIYEINPRATEICNDGIDNNCNSSLDCEDIQCAWAETCKFACGSRFPYFGDKQILTEWVCGNYFDSATKFQYVWDPLKANCAVLETNVCPETHQIKVEYTTACRANVRSNFIDDTANKTLYIAKQKWTDVSLFFSNAIWYTISRVLKNWTPIELTTDVRKTYTITDADILADVDTTFKVECEKINLSCAGVLVSATSQLKQEATRMAASVSTAESCRDIVDPTECYTYYEYDSSTMTYQQCGQKTLTPQIVVDEIRKNLYTTTSDSTKIIEEMHKSASFLQTLKAFLVWDKVYAMTEAPAPYPLLLLVEKWWYDSIMPDIQKWLTEYLSTLKTQLYVMMIDLPNTDESMKMFEANVKKTLQLEGKPYYIATLADKTKAADIIKLAEITKAAVIGLNRVYNAYYPTKTELKYCGVAAACVPYGSTENLTVNTKLQPPIVVMEGSPISIWATFVHYSVIGKTAAPAEQDQKAIIAPIEQKAMNIDSLIREKISEPIAYQWWSLLATIYGNIKDFFKTTWASILSWWAKSYAQELVKSSVDGIIIGDGLCSASLWETFRTSPQDCFGLKATVYEMQVRDEKGNIVVTQKWDLIAAVYPGDSIKPIEINEANREKLHKYTLYYVSMKLWDNTNRTPWASEKLFYIVDCSNAAGMLEKWTWSEITNVKPDLIKASPEFITDNGTIDVLLYRSTVDGKILEWNTFTPEGMIVQASQNIDGLNTNFWSKIDILDIRDWNMILANLNKEGKSVDIYRLSATTAAKIDSIPVGDFKTFNEYVLLNEWGKYTIYRYDATAGKMVLDEKLTATIQSLTNIYSMYVLDHEMYMITQTQLYKINMEDYSVSFVNLLAEIGGGFDLVVELKDEKAYMAYAPMGASNITLFEIFNDSIKQLYVYENQPYPFNLRMFNNAPLLSVYNKDTNVTNFYRYNKFTLGKGQEYTMTLPSINWDFLKWWFIWNHFYVMDSLSTKMDKMTILPMPSKISVDTQWLSLKINRNLGVIGTVPFTITNSDSLVNTIYTNGGVFSQAWTINFDYWNVIQGDQSVSYNVYIPAQSNKMQIIAWCTSAEINVDYWPYIKIDDDLTEESQTVFEEDKVMRLTDGTVMFAKELNPTQKEIQQYILDANGYVNVINKAAMDTLLGETSRSLTRAATSALEKGDVVVARFDDKNTDNKMSVFADKTTLKNQLLVDTEFTDQSKIKWASFLLQDDTFIKSEALSEETPCETPLLNYLTNAPEALNEAAKSTSTPMLVAVKWGSDGCKIWLSKPATITLELSEDLKLPQTIKIVTSEDGKVRTDITPKWYTVSDDGKLVTFKVDAFSYFALGWTTPTTPTPTTTTTNRGWWVVPFDADACTLTSTNKVPCANNDGVDEKGIDYSESYYDETCCPAYEVPVSDDEWAICTTYAPDYNAGYTFAFNAGITMMTPCSKARLDDPITRAGLAKVLVVFAKNILKMKNNAEVRWCNNYQDIEWVSADLTSYIITACEMGIMGIHTKYPDQALTDFMPTDLVSRAHLTTTTSRLVRGNEFDGGDPYRTKHMNKLKSEGIIENMTPSIKEKRGRVFIMLQKIASLRETE